MVKSGKKYNDLLNTARELFWKHGFKRVSIEEICQKSNVSKMTFYKYFPNKFELAKTIFSKLIEEGENTFRQIMGSYATPVEKVRKIMQMKADGTNNISPEFMQDFYIGGEPELKAFVEKRTREAWDVLKNDFKEAQKAGIFRKDFDPEFFIRVQYKLMELVEDENFTGMFSSQQEMIMEFANLLIYGIVEHK